MKLRWLAGMGVLFGAAACASTNVRTEAKAPEPARAAATPTPVAEKAPPPALASPEFDEQFAVTRQVVALERSIELYQTFIARAGDDPHFAEAVERSRDRIEDARLTICFLREEPCDASSAR